MLGFNPLASAPLADDGVIYLLGNDITTGSPVVGASSIAQDQNLTADSLTTGSPVVGASSIAQDQNLIPTGVTTGQPTAAPAVCVVNVVFQADSITTGQPVVGMLLLNPSVGRAIHVVTGAPNVCIIAANKPNRVIVAGANEAA
jgi:hypothetical protein